MLPARLVDPGGVMTCHSKPAEPSDEMSLVELHRLINYQFRALQRRWSDADLIKCISRAKQIKQLLQSTRYSSSQSAWMSPKPPTSG